jgi:hypothetical protein
MQGLAPADEYLVEYQTTPGKCEATDEGVFVPFSPNGCQWVMNAKFNPQRFDTPGVYRFVPIAAPNPAVGFDFKLFPR